ncbi:outer membrane lipoprotein carrier protein LolA [Cupriavidus pauculus]|uniref:outer membrane lipoprotein carrier protein LolA n=1 Tax=Cupriavidus pauculus TaxID=82633 RepID=UPI001FD011D1|nr:outer membrane lipoprotein carrier protein LolA [Cupriavidus pauculus]
MMRRHALGVIAALACLAAAPLRAEDLAAAVAARLTDAPVIRGQFEQTRRLAGFSQPLVSRGDFVVARGRGVVWTTREPVPSSLMVSPDRLVVRGADGKIQQQMQADAQPAMRIVGESMIAMLRGDFRALSSCFDVTGKLIGKQAWTLTLTPTDAGTRRVFARIELSGDQFVRNVKLEEASGDSSVVKMIDPVAAKQLDASEAQRFE